MYNCTMLKCVIGNDNDYTSSISIERKHENGNDEVLLVIFHPATRMEVKTRQSMLKSIAIEQIIPSLLT